MQQHLQNTTRCRRQAIWRRTTIFGDYGRLRQDYQGGRAARAIQVYYNRKRSTFLTPRKCFRSEKVDFLTSPPQKKNVSVHQFSTLGYTGASASRAPASSSTGGSTLDSSTVSSPLVLPFSCSHVLLKLYEDIETTFLIVCFQC